MYRGMRIDLSRVCCSYHQNYGSVHPATLIAVDAEGYAMAHAGMAAHASQQVWYRRLFTIFSQAIYINTYQEIGFQDAVSAGGDLDLD